MSVESASWLSQLTASNPPGTDNLNQGDDHIRLIKAVLQATFPTASKAFYFPTYLGKTANYTITSAQMHTHFGTDATSGNVTGTLPSLSASDIGWSCVVQKIDATSNTVSVAPPSGTINGGSSVSLGSRWDSVVVRWTGTTWYASAVVSVVTPTVTNLALTALNITGAAALTDIDVADYFPIYDTSAALNKKVSVLDVFDVINVLTEDTTPSSSNDFVVTWDASALSAKKVKLANLLTITVPSAATQAEMEAGSSTAVYTTPGTAKYAPGVAKVWAKVVVSGGVPSLAAGQGVSSVTDTALGRLTINFTTSFSTVHYAAMVSITRAVTTFNGNDRLACAIRNGTQAAGSIQLECWDEDGDLTDPDTWHFVAYGDV